MIARYVTAAEIPRSNNPLPDFNASWERFTGRDDPDQRYQLRRLCPCLDCAGTGRVIEGPTATRCPECRGEGRVLELVATAGTPEAVGAALVQLGREGEWDECPVGILDTLGEKNQKWLVRPWLPSARNATNAGRLLQRRRRLTR